MFAPLRELLMRLPAGVWPEHAALQALADEARVETRGGKPLRFVGQGPRPQCFEDRYEPRISLRGEMQVRCGDWHDLLNVLVWIAFPKAKAALNARHCEAIRAGADAGSRNRGPGQDALTLLDESGVVVTVCDDSLGDLLTRFHWKELFWMRRDALAARLRVFLFGHALYEKALRPYVGMTGSAVVLDVSPQFIRLSPRAQIEEVDRRLARHIEDPDRLASPRSLAPFPILGVPGWWAANAAESFYDDTSYFRPGRRR